MASPYDEDDFSEESFEGSSTASQKDDPPTLDDTLFDDNLYALFLNYMKSQQAVGSLMFLRDARNFRMMNQPHDVLVYRAGVIFMMYFSPGSAYPVPLSEEVKKPLIEYAFDPNAEVSVDLNIFSVAFGEVYNAVIPRFRDWLSSNEWREALPFHHLAPPTFNVVLTSNVLRVMFNKFLKAQLEHDGDGSVSRAFHVWKFCLIANDFREGKYTHEAHLENKKKSKKGEKGEKGDSGSSDSISDVLKGEEAGGEKKIKPEEYAKLLYKKYKHYISLPYDDTLPYSVYVVRALDSSIEEFDKSSLFTHWISLKQYQGTDFQAKTVHQSLTPEGFAEPPTLAAAITSSILPAFMAAIQGSEQGMNLEFLIDSLTFHRKFSMFDTSSSAASSSQDSSSSSKKTKTDMIDEAKRIFTKFLDKTEMYCDPSLVEEVRTLINKSSGKGVNPGMFRKCGAFIYHRSEHTWCREARASFGWVGRSYDNRSKNARAVEEEFSLKVLPDDFDLQLVPSLDDIFENAAFVQDYADYVNAKEDKIFLKFYVPYLEYFKTPVHEKKAVLNRVLVAFAEVAAHFTELGPFNSAVAKEIEHRERVTDFVVQFLCTCLARSGAKRYYKSWLVDRASVWKTAEWTPVPAVRFSELYLLVGLNAVSSKIEEEALKGKSGFSRYLAKRQLKKQTPSKVHTGQLKKGGSVVLSTAVFSMGGKDEVESKAQTSAPTLVIPSIHDTLCSPYLRKVFGTMFLETTLPSTEITLWEAFCAFYTKYISMSNEKLLEVQDEMRKEALEICDKFKALIKNSSAVKDRIKNLKFLFPNVFYPVEEELYTKHHADYEVSLRKKGWK